MFAIISAFSCKILYVRWSLYKSSAVNVIAAQETEVKISLSIKINNINPERVLLREKYVI